MDMTEIKINPPTNRLIGDMHRIGIRPTIDGRWGGVRESLEEQTIAWQVVPVHGRHVDGHYRLHRGPLVL
jgi:hypothetical protein